MDGRIKYYDQKRNGEKEIYYITIFSAMKEFSELQSFILLIVAIFMGALLDLVFLGQYARNWRNIVITILWYSKRVRSLVDVGYKKGFMQNLFAVNRKISIMLKVFEKIIRNLWYYASSLIKRMIMNMLQGL